jgi:hypothetical protein
MDLTEALEPNSNCWNTLQRLSPMAPIWAAPLTERQLLILMNSITLIFWHDPIAAMPFTESEAPMRTKERIEMDEPL